MVLRQTAPQTTALKEAKGGAVPNHFYRVLRCVLTGTLLYLISYLDLHTITSFRPGVSPATQLGALGPHSHCHCSHLTLFFFVIICIFSHRVIIVRHVVFIFLHFFFAFLRTVSFIFSRLSGYTINFSFFPPLHFVTIAAPNPFRWQTGVNKPRCPHRCPSRPRQNRMLTHRKSP